MTVLTSRDNPRVQRWRRLVQIARERRKEKRAMLEGPRLVGAYLEAGGVPEALILSESAVGNGEISALAARYSKPAFVLADPVFRVISDTETPAGIAAEIALSGAEPALEQVASCVFLEGIQDAGNVGAILRSAAAFGVRTVVLGRGCADAWSPRVLRAAMGAHFSLWTAERNDLAAAVGRFGGRTLCTVPRGGVPLPEVDLRGRVGWIFGTEGQGVSDALASCASVKVTIPMPGAAESLNVAAAAAICFYEMSRRLSTPGGQS